MKSKLRNALIAATVFIIILASLILYIRGEISALTSHAATGPTGNIIANFSIKQSSVLGYNNTQSLIEYVLLNYRISNVSSGNASMSVYRNNPTEPIYLIDTKVGALDYCFQCFDSGLLRQYLQQALATKGLIQNASSFNYVSLANISQIPQNSIVVLQAGLIQTSLMAPNSSYGGPSIINGNATLLTLLNRGDTVVYIGRSFATSIGAGEDVFNTTPEDLGLFSNISLDTEPFVFLPSNYSSSGITFHSTTFQFTKGVNYGYVSAVDSRNGTVIAFGNYPTAGWSSVGSMADDIAGIIDSRFWIPRLAYGTTNFTIRNSTGIIPVLTTAQPINNSGGTGPGEVNSSYSLIKLNLANQRTNVSIEIPFRITYAPQGAVNMPTVFGETQSLPVTAASSVNARGGTSFHIDVKNTTGSLYRSIPLGFIGTSQFSIVHYYSFAIPSGYYVASLVDINGKVYGSSLFSVANLNITPVSLNFKNGTFSFSMRSNGAPVSNTTYTASINGAYSQTGAVQNGNLTYTLPGGASEGYGSKTFTFSMFGANYTYATSYASAGRGIPPLYIEFGVATVFIIILNLVLKAPTTDDYYIDVPNFPPVKKVKLKVDTGSITGIFDAVNFGYRWKYMPLTAEEVKNGVSTNIRYENVPVAVTLQNITGVLNRLAAQGTLVSSGGYYAPAAWIAQSKHDIEYLAIFRKLRDFCVSNAMLFTDLDAVPNVDMIITRRGTQAHIIIHSPGSQMKDIALNSPYKIYITFLTESERLDFLEKLYNSYGEHAELLKIGIERREHQVQRKKGHRRKGPER